ncbi:MAG: radical SAM protein [Ruminiclostridium sp.]|nr:radical SAM protein [Ruminiclostridium sp.]
MKSEKFCNNCPRMCGVDRVNINGFCGCDFTFKIAKIMKHFGEEPVITGTNGSGTIFFSGCVLKCPFCQNYPISHQLKGSIYTESELEYSIYDLEQQGVHNINLVSPTQFLHLLIPVLEKCKSRLSIPVVYNTGGYERAEMIRKLQGLVDIYLPDLKYFDNSYGLKYSKADNYFDYASKSIQEMLRQQPECVIEDGIMKKGVIVRHLVLPTLYKDSMKLMEWLSQLENRPLVSVMRQYTPCYDADKYKELTRRITTFEYEKVVEKCAELGLQGFTQLKGCETLDMTPDF